MEKQKRKRNELTSVREETICSLGRLRAFTSRGGVKRAKNDMVVDVGRDTETNLKCCGLEEGMGLEDSEEEEGREGLGVAEARMANSIAICATAHPQSREYGCERLSVPLC